MAGEATIHDNFGGSGGGIWTGYSSSLHNCVAGTEGDPGVNVYDNTVNDIDSY